MPCSRHSARGDPHNLVTNSQVGELAAISRDTSCRSGRESVSWACSRASSAPWRAPSRCYHYCERETGPYGDWSWKTIASLTIADAICITRRHAQTRPMGMLQQRGCDARDCRTDNAVRPRDIAIVVGRARGICTPHGFRSGENVAPCRFTYSSACLATIYLDGSRSSLTFGRAVCALWMSAFLNIPASQCLLNLLDIKICFLVLRTPQGDNYMRSGLAFHHGACGRPQGSRGRDRCERSWHILVCQPVSAPSQKLRKIRPGSASQANIRANMHSTCRSGAVALCVHQQPAPPDLMCFRCAGQAVRQ